MGTYGWGDGRSRLQFYKQVHLEHTPASYTYLPFYQRKVIAKLRCSSHNLEVERGRHKKKPAEERLCQMCSEGAVENEAHFWQYGEKWKKPTLFCAWLLPVLNNRLYCCTGKHGMCSANAYPHTPLVGQDAKSCRFWTKIAEPYPLSLCAQIASLVQDQLATSSFAAPAKQAPSVCFGPDRSCGERGGHWLFWV